MKRKIYTALAGCLLLAGPTTAQITVLDQLSNDLGYVIQRTSTKTSEQGCLFGGTDKIVWVLPETEAKDKYYWAIYTSPQTGQRFVYNLGTKLFMALDTQGGKLQERATPMTLFPSILDKNWMMINNNRIAGMTEEIDTVLLSGEELPQEGMVFTFTPTERKLTDAELQEIEQKVTALEGDQRTELLQRIEAFLQEAKQQEGIPEFAGLYRYEKLEEAYRQESDYSNSELEELLAEAQQSIYPQTSGYYRLLNSSRPNANSFTENVLSIIDDPNVAGSMNLAGSPDGNQLPGTRKGTALESLSLFRFTASGAPATFYLSNAGTGLYAGGADGSQENENGIHLPLLVSRTDATPYELIHEGNQLFRFRNALQPKYYLTLNGESNAVSYDQLEDPELWYLEKVKSIDVAIGETGYASLCLPCPVELPSGVEAYVATSVEGHELVLKSIENLTGQRPVIPAFTPVILKTDAEHARQIFEMPISEEDSAPIENLLEGVTRHTTIPSGSYILGNGTEGVGFYPVDENDRLLASNRVYLPGTNITPQKQLVLRFEKPTTEIRKPESGNGEKIWYDLDGKRKMNPQKGIFISKDGEKKVMR